MLFVGRVLGGADNNLIIRVDASVDLKQDVRRDSAALYTVVAEFTTNEVGADYRPQTAWTVAPSGTADEDSIEQAFYTVLSLNDVAGIDAPTNDSTDYTLRVFVDLTEAQQEALIASEFIDAIGYPSM